MKQANLDISGQPQPKKLHGSYYRVMVNLPVIIKQKELIERKHTIEVFKKKTTGNQKQSTLGKSIQNKKSQDDQVGRIYINELWSEKFHKLVLKESKIQEVLERISKLYRRNVSEFVDDIHKASEAKHKNEDQLLNNHLQNSTSEAILPKILPLKGNLTYSSGQIFNDTLNQDEIEEGQEMPSQTQQSLSHLQQLKTQQQQSIDCIQSPNQFSLLINGSQQQPYLQNQSIQDNTLVNFFSQQQSPKQLNSQNSKSFLGQRNPSSLLKTAENNEEQVLDHFDFHNSLSKSVESPKIFLNPLKRKGKKHDLSQPKYYSMKDSMNENYFNSTQSIIKQCKFLNEDWNKERSKQSKDVPFYINKDDRY